MAPGTETRYDETKEGCRMISCFSDTGRSLLLKKTDDSVDPGQGEDQSGRIVGRIAYDLML